MEIPLIPRILLELEMQTGYYLNEKLHKVNYTVNVWNRCFRTKVLSTYCCLEERKEIYLHIIRVFLSGFNGQHDSVAVDSFFLLSFIVHRQGNKEFEQYRPLTNSIRFEYSGNGFRSRILLAAHRMRYMLLTGSAISNSKS